MTRIGRLLLDIPPQPDNKVIDSASIGVFAHTPDLFEHGFPRNRLPLMLNEKPQQVRLHQGQRQRLVADMQLERIEVDYLAGEQKAILAGLASAILQRNLSQGARA